MNTKEILELARKSNKQFIRKIKKKYYVDKKGLIIDEKV